MDQERNWSNAEVLMMHRALRLHLTRLLIVGIAATSLLALSAWTWNRTKEWQDTTKVEGLVRQLLSVEPEQLVSVIGHLSQNSEKAESLLRPLLTQEALSPSEKREQLHARLAMVSRDVKLVPFVINDLYTAKLLTLQRFATNCFPIRLNYKRT